MSELSFDASKFADRIFDEAKKSFEWTYAMDTGREIFDDEIERVDDEDGDAPEPGEATTYVTERLFKFILDNNQSSYEYSVFKEKPRLIAELQDLTDKQREAVYGELFKHVWCAF